MKKLHVARRGATAAVIATIMVNSSAVRAAQEEPASDPPAVPQDSGSTSTSDTTSNADTSQLTSYDTIVVTARKREEALQKVGATVTVLTNEDINNRGIQNLGQFLYEVPGLQFNQGEPNSSRFSIRGLTTESGTSALQNTVGIYIDDVPTSSLMGTPSLVDINAYDMSRIEVLRGPQGTLYGSASLGGAVNYITADPTSELSGRMGARLSSVKSGKLGYASQGYISVPFTPGSGVRISGSYRSDGGWVDNIISGDNNANDIREWVVRGKAKIELAPSVIVRLTGMTQKSETDENNSINPALPGYQRNVLVPNNRENRFDYFNANLNAGLMDGLSFVTSIGYTKFNTQERADASAFTGFVNLIATIVRGAPFAYSGVPFSFDDLRTHAWSGEARLQYESEIFDVQAGVFVRDEVVEYRGIYNFPGLESQLGVPFGALLSPGDLVFDQRVNAKGKEKAIFGEVTVKPLAGLQLTAGGRFFKNKINQNFEIPAYIFTPGVPFAPFAIGSDDDGFSPRFSVSYEWTQNLLTYALVTRGFRAGLGNSPAAVAVGAPQSVSSDSVTNYEGGFKSTFADGRILLNVAAYQADWDDIQLSVRKPPIPIAFRQNAGKARSRGVEIEARAKPTDNIELGFAQAFIKSTLTDPGGAISGSTGQPLTSGLRLPGTPKFTSNEWISFDVPVGGDLKPYIRLEHRYYGKNFADIENTTSQGNYNVFNLRAGAFLNNWRISADAENIFNSKGRTFVTPASAFQASFPSETYRLKPRTLTLTVERSF